VHKGEKRAPLSPGKEIFLNEVRLVRGYPTLSPSDTSLRGKLDCEPILIKQPKHVSSRTI
jgi:hypothetical protein